MLKIRLTIPLNHVVFLSCVFTAVSCDVRFCLKRGQWPREQHCRLPARFATGEVKSNGDLFCCRCARLWLHCDEVATRNSMRRRAARCRLLCRESSRSHEHSGGALLTARRDEKAKALDQAADYSTATATISIADQYVCDSNIHLYRCTRITRSNWHHNLYDFRSLGRFTWLGCHVRR